MCRIVVELDARANFHVRIALAEPIEFIEIDSRVIAVVIGEGDVAQARSAGAVDPRLQQRLRIRLNAMTLRMRVVIGEKRCS